MKLKNATAPLVLGVEALCGVSSTRAQVSLQPHDPLAATAVDLKLMLLAGTELELTQLSGKVSALSFAQDGRGSAFGQRSSTRGKWKYEFALRRVPTQKPRHWTSCTSQLDRQVSSQRTRRSFSNFRSWGFETSSWTRTEPGQCRGHAVWSVSAKGPAASSRSAPARSSCIAIVVARSPVVPCSSRRDQQVER
jgi:hypothetical protein